MVALGVYFKSNDADAATRVVFPLGGVVIPAPTPRTLFWVGGTGNWPNSAHWSLSSGGAGGAPAPVSVDTVTLDGSSGGGTVTMTGTVTVASITKGAFTGTLNTNAQTLNVGTVSDTGTATRGLNITNSTLNITGIGSCWNFSVVTGLTFTGTGSIINISGNGARTLNFGAISTYGTVNVTGSGAVTCGNQAATFVNLKRNGTSVTTDSFIVGNFTISGTLTLAGNSQINRLMVQSSAIGTQRTLTAAAVSIANVDFSNITAAGAASPFTGTSLGDASGNSNITFTVAVPRYLVAAGGKSYSDITAWSASSGGATGATMPLPQDTAVADPNSFTVAGQAFTFDVPRIGAQDWSAVTSTQSHYVLLTWANNILVYGNFNIPFGGPFFESSSPGPGNFGPVDAVGNFTTTFVAQGGSTLNVNIHVPSISAVGGQTILDGGLLGNIIIQAPGGTVQLQSCLLTKAVFTHNAGSFVSANFDMQATNWAFAGTATRTLTLGSSRVLASSNSGTGTPIFNFTNTGITNTANTARLETFSGSSSVRIANLAGLSFGSWLDWYHDLGFNSAAVQVNGGATFSSAFTVNPSTLARSYTFQSGQTFTFGSAAMNGASGALLTLNASTAASQATLSDASGTNALTFMSIKDIACTGGATWTATNSTNGGNNSGITIS